MPVGLVVVPSPKPENELIWTTDFDVYSLRIALNSNTQFINFSFYTYEFGSMFYLSMFVIQLVKAKTEK